MRNISVGKANFCRIILNLDQRFGRFCLNAFLSRSLSVFKFSLAEPFVIQEIKKF